MPYVNIRVAGSLSTAQKEEICARVTNAIAEVANKPPQSVLVFIDEVARENISVGGKLLSNRD